MTRNEFVALFESTAAAVDFENTVLSVGRAFLPAEALAVLDGAEPTPEYWAWLATQLDGAESPE